MSGKIVSIGGKFPVIGSERQQRDTSGLLLPFLQPDLRPLLHRVGADAAFAAAFAAPVGQKLVGRNGADRSGGAALNWIADRGD